jgi:hypothetical protein
VTDVAVSLTTGRNVGVMRVQTLLLAKGPLAISAGSAVPLRAKRA